MCACACVCARIPTIRKLHTRVPRRRRTSVADETGADSAAEPRAPTLLPSSPGLDRPQSYLAGRRSTVPHEDDQKVPAAAGHAGKSRLMRLYRAGNRPTARRHPRDTSRRTNRLEEAGRRTVSKDLGCPRVLPTDSRDPLTPFSVPGWIDCGESFSIRGFRVARR